MKLGANGGFTKQIAKLHSTDDLQGGYDFGKTQKSKLPQMAQGRRRNSFAAPFAAPFVQYYEFFSKFG